METVIGTRESGLIMLDKVLASNTIQMVITTQVNGRRIKKVEKHCKFNILDSPYRNKDKKEGKGQYFYSSNERYEGPFGFLRTFKLILNVIK